MILRTIVSAALLIASTVASADQVEASARTDDAESSAYILSVDSNSPGIEHLNSGDYDAAITAAGTTAQHSQILSAHLVMCAAHIRKASIVAAQYVCDMAIELAQQPITTSRNPHGHKNREGLAMAYSNRGVLRAVSGDSAGANADFERALQQNRRTDVAIHNKRINQTAARVARNNP